MADAKSKSNENPKPNRNNSKNNQRNKKKGQNAHKNIVSYCPQTRKEKATKKTIEVKDPEG